MRISLVFLLSLFAVSLQATPLKVAVTHPFFAEWVKTVGGDEVEAVVITKDDTAALSEAAIVYENGLGQEPWLDAALETNNSTARRIVLSDGIPTMTETETFWAEMPLPHPNPEKMPECCRKDAADSNAAWVELVDSVKVPKDPTKFGYDPNAVDPNLWYNPLNAQGAVLVINETLAEELPEQGDNFDRNAYAYLDTLGDLDGWIKSRVRDIPMAQRILVTDEGSFRYYAKAYGMAAPLDTPEYMGLVFLERDPSKMDHPCACEGPKLLTVTEVDSAATYEALMRHDTEVITEALTAPATL